LRIQVNVDLKKRIYFARRKTMRKCNWIPGGRVILSILVVSAIYVAAGMAFFTIDDGTLEASPGSSASLRQGRDSADRIILPWSGGQRG